MIDEFDRLQLAIQGRRFLRWLRSFFFLAGALGVSYVAVTLIHARLFQQAAIDTIDKQVFAAGRQSAARPKTVAKEGDLLGHLQIPRLNLKVAVLEGTASRTLRLGAGHISGTALPGEPGNVSIAGHRDTFFRSLEDIREGDEIQMRTASGYSSYKVDWVQIVAADDTGILTHSPESAITLVTCYPFHFIGAAPERFVVHAHRD